MGHRRDARWGIGAEGAILDELTVEEREEEEGKEE
jgi:hypothetical protein